LGRHWEVFSVTKDELRAAADQLVRLHERFAPLFGRQEARQQSLVYLHGLLLASGRKNAEAMALEYGTPKADGISQLQVLGLQRFLTYSPWDYQDVQREIQKVFALELMPSAATWSIGTVGVFDSSGFPKKGDESVGVARQYCGRLGKTDNCQVGVFLAGVTPAGSVLLDHQLYLPKEWAQDQKRRQKTHVPKDVRFRTELQLALELLRRTTEPGVVRFDWVTADDTYGRNGHFLDALEKVQQRYLLDVPATTTVWRVDPATQVPPPRGRGRPPSRPRRDWVCSVKELAESLPTSAWHALQVREGACNPLVFEFAVVRVWAVRHRKPGPPIWVLIRRSLEGGGEIKYGVSHAAEDTPVETLALVSGCRFRVDELFQDGKTHLGMSQYESRAWSSWHHHMSLVGLAHLCVTLTKVRLKKKRRS
jgi:SRSO17 transposase